jgi:hypothetical protein
MQRLFLLGAMLALSGLAHAGWREASTDSYLIYSDSSREQLVSFAERVEKFDHVLRVMTGVQSPPSPVKLRIYLVPDAATVENLSGVKSAAGYYRPVVRSGIALVSSEHGYSEFSLRGEVILFHEYCHHFMAQYSHTSYPAWYVEGFAEFYGNTVIRRDNSFETGRLDMARLPDLFRGTWLPVGKLLTDDLSELPAERWSQFYAEGWLLTHYMLTNDQRAAQFRQYLSLRGQGVADESALQQALGTSSAGLDGTLRSYLGAKHFLYRRVQLQELGVPQVSVRELSPAQSELLLPALHVELGTADKKDARLLNEIRSKAARFPVDRFARRVNAEAEATLGDPAIAEQLLQRLIEEDPADRRAMLDRAWLKIAGNQADATARLAADRDARHLAAQANRLLADDPEALLLFYLSFKHEESGPTANAVAGLQQAYALLPQRQDTALLVAHEYVRAGNPTAAVRVLRPIAYSPHESQLASQTRAWIQRLEAKAGNEGVPADAPSAVVQQ